MNIWSTKKGSKFQVHSAKGSDNIYMKFEPSVGMDLELRALFCGPQKRARSPLCLWWKRL